MSFAMTSFDVKLSVVPGWKCSGQVMADCFEVSVGIIVAILICYLSLLQSEDGTRWDSRFVGRILMCDSTCIGSSGSCMYMDVAS